MEQLGEADQMIGEASCIYKVSVALLYTCTCRALNVINTILKLIPPGSPENVTY